MVLSGIRKMEGSNAACVFHILLSIDITPYFWPPKFSAYDTLFP